MKKYGTALYGNLHGDHILLYRDFASTSAFAFLLVISVHSLLRVVFSSAPTSAFAFLYSMSVQTLLRVVVLSPTFPYFSLRALLAFLPTRAVHASIPTRTSLDEAVVVIYCLIRRFVRFGASCTGPHSRCCTWEYLCCSLWIPYRWVRDGYHALCRRLPMLGYVHGPLRSQLIR